MTLEGASPPDDEENFGLPAGYTYFGQFVDHDITFDPLSSLVKLNDPNGLIDFQTPALDLDGLYGRGPDDQPYIYDHAPRLHFFNYKCDPFMPVEFSGAAYRFGHSMVRPAYRLSAANPEYHARPHGSRRSRGSPPGVRAGSQ